MRCPCEALRGLCKRLCFCHPYTLLRLVILFCDTMGIGLNMANVLVVPLAIELGVVTGIISRASYCPLYFAFRMRKI